MDILKIFVSTLVVLCITAIVFFGLYFLFPSLSDSVFGVSYAHGCTIDGIEERAVIKATMDDMKSGIKDTMKGAVESVSSVASNAVATVMDAFPEADGNAMEADVETAIEKVSEVVENVDVEVAAETFTEAEEAVVEFFSSGNGDRFLSELKKEDIIPDDFDIAEMADSEEGKELVRNIASFVETSGVDLADALSNAKLHKMISGKADETLDALKGLFAGGLK